MHRALLIANSTFPADAHNLPDLIGPRTDAEHLGRALVHREAGLFPHDQVKIISERRASDVLAEIRGLLR